MCYVIFSVLVLVIMLVIVGVVIASRQTPKTSDLEDRLARIRGELPYDYFKKKGKK